MHDTTTKSTLHGWLPEPGAMVWQQMYSPVDPSCDSTIEERIADGHTYGGRRLMRVIEIVRDYDGIEGRTRYVTIEADRPFHIDLANPWARGWLPGMSATESDWCVLEDASEDAGVLF